MANSTAKSKAAKSETTEVVVYEGDSFVVATQDVAEITEIINETLGGESLTPRDLERIKIPAGGGTVWEIPTFDGIEAAQQLEGIIIHTETNRAYWATEYDGGKTPPDCSSFDLRTGHGSPGGDCKTCPMNEFGTGFGGRSKACQEKRVIFLLRPDSMLPICIYIPAASLDNAKKYLLMKLAARKLRPYQVVTGFTLEKDKNADGKVYSKVNFANIGMVPEPAKIEAYVKSMKPALERAAKESVSEPAGTPDFDSESQEAAF